MKKISFAFVVLSTVLLSVSCVFIHSPKEAFVKLPGNGKKYSVMPFNKIRAEGVFNIVLLQGNQESVVVKGELPKGLTIKNKGETLVINDTSNRHSSGHNSINTYIYITFKSVNDISIESVGQTKCGDTLNLKNLSFHTEGVGATILWVNADTVNAFDEGVGKLTLAGEASFAIISDSGVGALDASTFKPDVLHANVSGVGAARVYAVKEMYLISSGVGGVEYSGPATIMENKNSGVGTVERAN